MSNRIDIVITEAPQVNAATPPLYNSNLTEEATGFNWVIAAQGGFKTASIELVTSRDRAFDILQRFLSKRVIFTTPGAAHTSGIVWEGMVYQVTIDDGKRTVTRSMANVYNQVKVVYSATDYTQAKPQGSQQSSVVLNDTTSQALYGLRMLTYTVGEMNVTDAQRLNANMLARYAYPQTVLGGESIGGGIEAGAARVTIGCTGYAETLDKYIYKDPFIAVTALDSIVRSVINTFATAGPTTIIKTDYTNVVANAFTRSEYQDKDITALDYMQDICGYGSAAVTEQNLFGVLEDRTIYYTPFPTTASYWMSVYDESENIYNAAGTGIIEPWNVRPGKIISIGDVLANGPVYDADVLKVQSFVIGEVEFTAPNKVRLTPWVGDPTQVVLSRIAGSHDSGLSEAPIKTFEGNEMAKVGDRMRGYFVGRDEVVWRAASVRRAAVQAIPKLVATALTMDTVVTDTDGMWNAGNPTRLTAKVNGWYMVTARCGFGPDVAGTERYLEIAVNGVANALSSFGTFNAVSNTYMSVTATVFLNSNDYVEAVVYQAGAAAVNTFANYPALILCRFP